jgi:hypothetical protein
MYRTPVGSHPLNLSREELEKPGVRDEYEASLYMFEYEYARRVSNFLHHYVRSHVEALPVTVKARKLFYEADVARQNGASGERVLAIYRNPGALKAWRDEILLKPDNKEFRHDNLMQEDTYGIQLRYLLTLNKIYANPLNWKAAQLVLAPVAVPWAGAAPLGLPGVQVPLMPTEWWEQKKDWFDRLETIALLPGSASPVGALALVGDWLVLPPWWNWGPMRPDWWDNPTTDWVRPLFGGPFDGEDDEGIPLLTSAIRGLMKERYFPAALQKKKPAPGAPPSPTAPQPGAAGGAAAPSLAR